MCKLVKRLAYAVYRLSALAVLSASGSQYQKRTINKQILIFPTNIEPFSSRLSPLSPPSPTKLHRIAKWQKQVCL